jgi:DNA-binding NarL/FixJ family response regulator
MVTTHTREQRRRTLVAWWPPGARGRDVLTPEEMHAAALRARGAPLKAVASDLGRSGAAVSYVLAGAMRKLRLECLSELVAFFSSWPEDVTVHALGEGEERVVVVSYRLPPLSLPRCLSNAERRVVEGLVEGRSYKAIAHTHGIALRTVANHVASVHEKLAVHSRLELVAVLQRGSHPSELGAGV